MECTSAAHIPTSRCLTRGRTNLLKYSGGILIYCTLVRRRRLLRHVGAVPIPFFNKGILIFFPCGCGPPGGCVVVLGLSLRRSVPALCLCAKSLRLCPLPPRVSVSCLSVSAVSSVRLSLIPTSIAASRVERFAWMERGSPWLLLVLEPAGPPPPPPPPPPPSSPTG